ncbi:hypothetical protein ACQCTO_27870, partial [Escherichia coli]|uniref:hypothetical protein n=1 Tax=Escherichia coli TaxID=562 RepID=UPI003CEA53BF
RQKQKKLIMLPSETMIWQPEFTDKTLSRKPGAVHFLYICTFLLSFVVETNGVCHADANRQIDSRANSPIIMMEQQR